MVAGRMTHPATRRPWFRYSLRTLFVVMTVVCVYLGWAMNWNRQRRDFIRERLEVGAQSFGPTRGQLDAPFPLRMFGEIGEEWIDIGASPVVDGYEARRLFPEAHWIGFKEDGRHTEWYEATQWDRPVRPDPIATRP